MSFRWIRLRSFAAVCLIAPVIWAGCGPSMPENQFESIQKANQEAESALRSMGTLELKSYGPLGNGWSVKLPKVQFDDKVIENLARLGRVTEFHISGATITDAQMQTILESSIAVFFNNVDISDTSLSDAGVVALPNCKWLQKLNVKGTKVTDSFLSSMRTKRKANTEVPVQCKNVQVTK